MIIPTGAGAPYMAFMRADCKYRFGSDAAMQAVNVNN
jgi:hypothetical protein